MSFWSRLFSSPKVIENTVDGVISGVDKAIFTEEEKSDAKQRALNVYEKMWLAAVPSALSRRIIAFFVVFVWAVVILAMLVGKALGADEFATFAFKIMDEIVFHPFNIIIGFYFLKQVIGSMQAK